MAAMRGMDMNGLVPRKGNGSVAGAPERPNETCPQVGHDSMAGLVLLDSHKRPVYANGEAIRALAYPEEAGKMKPSAHVLAEKVCSLMPDGQDSAFSAKEFISGRRRYLCRVFQLESGHRNGGAPAVAILMERTRCVSFLLSATIEHFRLTAREEEAVKLLLEGCRTDAHQPKYGQGLSPPGHDQDGRLHTLGHRWKDSPSLRPDFAFAPAD